VTYGYGCACRTRLDTLYQLIFLAEFHSVEVGAVSSMRTDELIRKVVTLLQKNDDVYERNFVSQLGKIGIFINDIRNSRGEISRGRHIPKELINDQDLSRLLREITESLSCYLISSFFSFKLEQFKEEPEIEENFIRYKDNAEFNELLDEDYPYNGKIIYSQALYELCYEDYMIQLQTFIDEQELFSKQ
jgi:hypothetical protein